MVGTDNNEKSEIQNILFETYDRLMAEIDIWKQKYLLITPVEGIVTFNKFWSKNQNVSEGEVVLTVLPLTTGDIVGKITEGVAFALQFGHVDPSGKCDGLVRDSADHVDVVGGEV